MKTYPGGDEPFADLISGRLDYVLNDNLVTQKIIEKNPGCCRIVADIPRDGVIFGPGVGAAVRPEDADLRDIFNAAITELKADGTFKRLDGQVFHHRHRPQERQAGGGAGELTRQAGRRRAGRRARAGRAGNDILGAAVRVRWLDAAFAERRRHHRPARPVRPCSAALPAGCCWPCRSLSRIRALRAACDGYTTFFRGIPDLLALFIVYFGIQVVLNHMVTVLGPGCHSR